MANRLRKPSLSPARAAASARRQRGSSLTRAGTSSARMRSPAGERDLKDEARLSSSRSTCRTRRVRRLPSQRRSGPTGGSRLAEQAGYGAGAVEAGTREQVERQFDVNVFGLIACVRRSPRISVAKGRRSRQHLVDRRDHDRPGLRRLQCHQIRGRGPVGGAVVRTRNVRVKVKVIEPGAIKTDFGGQSQDAWDLSARAPLRALHGEGESGARGIRAEF